VIVDLTRCEFIDSSVVSLLLQAQGEIVSDGGRFALVVPSRAPAPALARMSDLMQFDALFPIHTSLDAARATLGMSMERRRHAAPQQLLLRCPRVPTTSDSRADVPRHRIVSDCGRKIDAPCKALETSCARSKEGSLLQQMICGGG
jgi:hypothetical protein